MDARASARQGVLRVGLVSGEYPPDVGGVGDHTCRLAGELTARGHMVQVVTTAVHSRPGAGGAGGPGGLPQPEVWRAISRWDWRILATLPRLARRGAWDVLHIQYQTGAYALHPAINLLPGWLARVHPGGGAGDGRRTGPPAVVTTFHDLRVPYLFPKAGALRQLAVRHLARASQGAIAAAAEDVRRLAEWTRPLPRPPAIAHVPLGNSLDTPPPPDFDPGAWRARLGIPAGASLAGHFGFINRSKAVDALVGAVAQLAGEGRDLHLLMIGDPAGASDPTNAVYLAEVRRQIGALGLAGRVHWTGFGPPATVAGWLRCLDVAVLPFRDGASLRRTSILAAWSQGLPVVTTAPADAGIGPAALVVPLADAATLAAAMRTLLDDPVRRRALGLAGARYATRFSWPEVTAQTEALYRRVLADRGGHG